MTDLIILQITLAYKPKKKKKNYAISAICMNTLNVFYNERTDFHTNGWVKSLGQNLISKLLTNCSVHANKFQAVFRYFLLLQKYAFVSKKCKEVSGFVFVRVSSFFQ